MDPEEIAPVQALRDRKPKTIGDLRQLLGFLSYYHIYIPSFSQIARPLYQLLSAETSTEKKTVRRASFKKTGEKRRKTAQIQSSQPLLGQNNTKTSFVSYLNSCCTHQS